MRGQGATDYLLLVAVVLLIGVIVASLVALAGTGGIPNARQLQSDAYWRAMRPLGILDSTLNPDGSAAVAFTNNDDERITITRIDLDGMSNPLFAELGPGESLLLNFTNRSNDCEHDLMIYYLYGDLDLIEQGNVPLYLSNCDPNTPACIPAGSPATGTCCSGSVNYNGNCVKISGTCTDNSECISGRCTFGTCSATSSGCDARCQSSNPTLVCAGTWESTCTEDELASCGGETSCNPSEYVQCSPTCLCVPDDGFCDPSDDLCCNANCNATTYTCGGGSPLDGGCGEPPSSCTPSNPPYANGTCCSDYYCSPTGNLSYACNGWYQCLPSGEQCMHDYDCCYQYCNDGICAETDSGCTPEGHYCSYDADCCPGMACNYNTHVCTVCVNESCSLANPCCGDNKCISGECVPCGIGGQLCDELNPCCNSYVCSEHDGEYECRNCAMPPDRCTPGKVACCDGYKCTGSYPNFLCEVCVAKGADCEGDSDCCENLMCDEGVCADVCTPSGGSCKDGSTCCEGTVCTNGFCTGCALEGQTCSGTNLCCDGFGCISGRCRICSDKTCSPLTPCCSGKACEGGNCITCVESGSVCKDGQPCCADSTCISGTCTTCVGEFTTCTPTKPCCAGLYCGGDSYCHGCSTGSCSELEPCCEGLTCEGGTCMTECSTTGGSCLTPHFCCDGYQCASNICEQQLPGCSNKGEFCDLTHTCCEGEGLSCDNNECTICSMESCSPDTPCCSGLACGADNKCASCVEMNGDCRDAPCCYGSTCVEGICKDCSYEFCSTQPCCYGYTCNDITKDCNACSTTTCGDKDPQGRGCCDGFFCDAGGCKAA